MMRVRLPAAFKYALAAAAVSAALSSDASARQQQQSRAQELRSPTAQRAGAREADANADLSITARVTAAELRFEKVPNTRVEFSGKPGRETVWEAERENLPPQVRPGVTYRDVGITLRITSVFADIDRIVAEALGELPPGDEARPAPAQPPTTSPTQPPGTPPATPSSSETEPTAAAVAAPPSKSSPANSAVTNAPRRRPAQRGGGK